MIVDPKFCVKQAILFFRPNFPEKSIFNPKHKKGTSPSNSAYKN